MKLTPELLRKIIKEEMTRAENAPISLTPNQLRKIIVAEAAKLAGTGLLSEQNADLDVLKTVIDAKTVIRRRRRGRPKPKPTPGKRLVDTLPDDMSTDQRLTAVSGGNHAEAMLAALTKYDSQAEDLYVNSFGTYVTMGK